MHGPAVYVKGRECFMLYLQKIVWIFTYDISWLYFTQCLTSFSSADHLFLCTVFDSNSSNIDEILSIKPSAITFVFGDLNVHHKNWLTYSGGTNRPGELRYNFQVGYPPLYVTFSVHPFVCLSVCHAPYLRNCTSSNHNLWYMCKMMISPGVFFIILKL